MIAGRKCDIDSCQKIASGKPQSQYKLWLSSKIPFYTSIHCKFAMLNTYLIEKYY